MGKRDPAGALACNIRRLGWPLRSNEQTHIHCHGQRETDVLSRLVTADPVQCGRGRCRSGMAGNRASRDRGYADDGLLCRNLVVLPPISCSSEAPASGSRVDAAVALIRHHDLRALEHRPRPNQPKPMPGQSVRRGSQLRLTRLYSRIAPQRANRYGEHILTKRKCLLTIIKNNAQLPGFTRKCL